MRFCIRGMQTLLSRTRLASIHWPKVCTFTSNRRFFGDFVGQTFFPKPTIPWKDDANLWIWGGKEGRYRVSPFRLRKCQSVCSTKIDGIRTSRTGRSHESPGYPSRYRSAPTDTWWSEISISNASRIFAADWDSVLSNSLQATNNSFDKGAKLGNDKLEFFAAAR